MRCFFSMWRFDRETTVNKLLPPAFERHFNCCALVQSCDHTCTPNACVWISRSLQKSDRPSGLWVFSFYFSSKKKFTLADWELKHKIITKKEHGSGSARLAQESSFSSQRLVLLDVVLLEAHGNPLGHLQVLLETRLRAAGLRDTNKTTIGSGAANNLQAEPEPPHPRTNYRMVGQTAKRERWHHTTSALMSETFSQHHHSSSANHSSTEDAHLQLLWT